MHAEWRKFVARQEDVRADLVRSSVVVTFANSRRHEVRIKSLQDGYVLEAVIAGPRETARLNDAVMTAWQKNRRSRVVGYRVDARGRFVAHAWSPSKGLTRDMFLFLVRTLAREADRHELLITGADRN